MALALVGTPLFPQTEKMYIEETVRMLLECGLALVQDPENCPGIKTGGVPALVSRDTWCFAAFRVFHAFSVNVRVFHASCV